RHAQLRQAVEFAEAWHGRADGRISVIMAPNMTISSSPELLRETRAAADRLGLRLRIHLGWGPARRRVVQRLHRVVAFRYPTPRAPVDSSAPTCSPRPATASRMPPARPPPRLAPPPRTVRS